MLDRSVLQAPLLDHESVDLDSARRITYVLEQSFRYDYDAPVRSLRRRLVIVPPTRHGSQCRRAHRLEVIGAAAQRCLRRDARGNVVASLRADHVRASIEFRLAAVIERIRDDGPAVLPAAALAAAHLHRPTRLTAADDRLRALAADLGKPARSPLDSAERICAAVHAAMSYACDVTSVRKRQVDRLTSELQQAMESFSHPRRHLPRQHPHVDRAARQQQPAG